MIVLGIETTCDETAAALVTDGRAIVAEDVLSQLAEHRPYGGIVPEIAARSHLDHIDGLIARVMKRAGVGFAGLDGVAVTGGPGLIGGVIVGVMTAKAIAAMHGLALINVNHLEAHALTCRLTDDVAFPYLLLLVTGGHCQILIVEGVGRYRRLGTTLDDAIGEAFDKAAKMLGLGYPGGPELERHAAKGEPKRFQLPRPLMGRPGCDFSFSGLKTAMRHRIQSLPPGELNDADVDDLCAAFQLAVGDVVTDRMTNAIKAYQGRHKNNRTLVVSGGVAANRYIRDRLAALAADHDFRLAVPAPELCTDNGVIVAWAGVERLRLGLTDPFDFAPRPRWPLDPEAQRAIGAGIKA
ncbi:MAG: tRNA (adenosine(37)-N6)-threonylcarbamoyltransferase complex transferase subunit TsaD [Alphaproteobacteria bacterium]